MEEHERQRTMGKEESDHDRCPEGDSKRRMGKTKKSTMTRDHVKNINFVSKRDGQITNT